MKPVALVLILFLFMFLSSVGAGAFYYNESSKETTEDESQGSGSQGSIGNPHYCLTNNDKDDNGLLNPYEPIYLNFEGSNKSQEERNKEALDKCKSKYPNAEVVRSYWDCNLDGEKVSDLYIWWGYRQSDAKWACNNWAKDECQKKCEVTPSVY
jgi:hypothetical protein